MKDFTEPILIIQTDLQRINLQINKNNGARLDFYINNQIKIKNFNGSENNITKLIYLLETSLQQKYYLINETLTKINKCKNEFYNKKEFIDSFNEYWESISIDEYDNIEYLLININKLVSIYNKIDFTYNFYFDEIYENNNDNNDNRYNNDNYSYKQKLCDKSLHNEKLKDKIFEIILSNYDDLYNLRYYGNIKICSDIKKIDKIIDKIIEDTKYIPGGIKYIESENSFEQTIKKSLLTQFVNYIKDTEEDKIKDAEENKIKDEGFSLFDNEGFSYIDNKGCNVV